MSFGAYNGLRAPAAAPGNGAEGGAPPAGATVPPPRAEPGTEMEPCGGTAPDKEREIGVAPGTGTTTRPQAERPPPEPPEATSPLQ